MIMRKLIFIFFISLSVVLNAQSQLQPGFNAKEYAELLSLAYFGSSIPDSVERKTGRDPYHLEYRSPEVGLVNRWSFYLRNDNVGVIEIRGTINQTLSWLANFYMAMIPATGSLQINDSTTFQYQLASDPKASVHAGWTVALAHLAPDIEEKINSYYKKNVKQFYLFGHSQGAAINFLLRSFLEYEKQKGKIPTDVVFKTYCSAAPKPGNQYYAYDFDFITRNGWAYTVVNTADWVPETPYSIQSVNELNPTNPLLHTKDIIGNQKWVVRVAVKKVYNQTTNSTEKAQKKFRKYLGTGIYKQIKKSLPQFKEPKYVTGVNYTRAGIPIILMPDEDYRRKFPESDKNYFVHHGFNAYYDLLKKNYLTP
jgi:lipase (class 3)